MLSMSGIKFVIQLCSGKTLYAFAVIMFSIFSLQSKEKTSKTFKIIPEAL